MRIKHGSIALILIQLFVFSAIVGALSPTVSAADNGPNARARAISDNESSRAGFVGGDMVRFYNKKGMPHEEPTSIAYVFAKPEEVVDPISPHVIPLDESDALFQRTASIAEYLNSLGFTISHSNLAFSLNSSHYSTSVSAYGSINLFNNVFDTNVEPNRDETVGHSNTPEITIPEPIREKVRSVEFPQPSVLYGEAWPPPQNISYYRLSPNEDSTALMNTTVWSSHSVENVTGALKQRQTYGYNGRRVDVAVLDSGFYFNQTIKRYHRFYEEYYSALLKNRYFPHDNMGLPHEDYGGHGTGIVSNLLAVAPGINLHFIRYAPNIDALTIALQINPDVVSCSWGTGHAEVYSDELNQDEQQMEDLINQLVANGAIVVFAGGNLNGKGWPASMPTVVAVGGVYIDENGNHMASNYSSSFESRIYPNRHVPDICGAVGFREPIGPRAMARYIQMPTQPGSYYDDNFGDYDETSKTDGWVVGSGTSSAAPQVAGLAAIVKQLNPTIQAEEFKNLIGLAATDVTSGESSWGEPAGEGYDNATGYGLINVHETVWRALGPVRNKNTRLKYATIQEAINAPETLDGHKIEVDAGTYYENVAVNKSLTLVGEGSGTTTIDGGGTGNVVTVQSNNVQISQFTIQNGEIGIYLEYSNNTSVSDNIVLNNDLAIYLLHSSSNTVSGNTVSDNNKGIYLFEYSENNIVSGNTVTNNGYASTDAGIYLHRSRHNTVSGNTVSNNTKYGIYLYLSQDTEITENEISNNTHGLRLYNCESSEYNCIIYHNNFINNSEAQASRYGSPYLSSTWDDGYPSGGNYWSDYTGVDEMRGPNQNKRGSDGIGDTPYAIDENNQDNYPLMNP